MLLVNSVSTAILFRGGGRQTVREFLIVFKGTLLIIIIIIIIFK